MLHSLKLVVAEPIVALGITELHGIRTERLEPREASATAYLKEHDEIGPAAEQRPELRALADRIVEATLLGVARVLAMPLQPLSVDELLSFRAETLEATQQDVMRYLQARGALMDATGQPRAEMVDLEDRIIECTLEAVSRVVDTQTDDLSADELLALRSEKQLPMQRESTEYLKQRGALIRKDGMPHMPLAALEHRIVATTLLRVSRSLPASTAAMGISELKALRSQKLEPLETSTVAFLKARGQLHDGEGELHPELLALEDAIVACTLAMAERMLDMPFATIPNVELLTRFRTMVEWMQKETTEHLTARGAMLQRDGQSRLEVKALHERTIEVTLAMVALLAAKPIDTLSIDELLKLRADELEPMGPNAEGYLSSRDALLDDNGQPRKELVALEEKIVNVTLTMVDRLVASPLDTLSVDELRAFRDDQLQVMQTQTMDYLRGRGQLHGNDGTPHESMVRLEERIVECACLMATRLIEMPIDRLSVAEMRRHRKDLLEPMEREATEYLSRRNALNDSNGQPQPAILALSDRIVETTLLMVTRVVEVPIEELTVDELRALRSGLEPMLPEAQAFLRRRGALVDENGITQPEITALSNRIIEIALLMVSRVLETPLEEMSIPELLAHRSSPLESMEAETTEFLRKRNALLGPDGLTWPQVVALADRIVEATLLVVTRLLERDLDELETVEDLIALRDEELQPALKATWRYLHRRNALHDREGEPHPHLEQLEGRIIDVTLTTVERVLAMPVDEMSVEELKEFRAFWLEATKERAAQHLESRGAAFGEDGLPHPQMIALDERIIAVTLLMVSRVIEKPLEELSIGELLALRTNELEPMMPAATRYLIRRKALYDEHGSVRQELIDLEDRILACTLATVERVLEIPIDGLSTEELLALRANDLEPIGPSTEAYLAGRNASVGKDGEPWPQLVALNERIVEVTLLVARQLLSVPIDEMEVGALIAFRDDELLPQIRATMAYLSERNVLADPETGGHREEVLALREYVTAVNDR